MNSILAKPGWYLEEKKKVQIHSEWKPGRKMFNLANGWALVAMETQLWIE